MSERREPTISPLNLDKEEVARPRATAATPPPKRTAPPPPPVSGRPVVVRSRLAPLAFILALAAGGFAGFVYWQLQLSQQQVQKNAAALAAAEARVVELEKRLALSGDESSQSITALQANIKENASEIRKLWGVSNDRNRKAIAQLEERATALEKNLGGVDGRIKSAVSELTGELKVLSDLVEAQQTSIQSADQAVKSQVQNLAALTKKLEQLEQSDNDLRKKVQAHEEAIKAVDAFRLQVNRELIRLKGG
jgi:DNA repair exonuclease SbcCD ATPase subunit